LAFPIKGKNKRPPSSRRREIDFPPSPFKGEVRRGMGVVEEV
jgi:hypothetical protein